MANILIFKAAGFSNVLFLIRQLRGLIKMNSRMRKERTERSSLLENR